MVQIDEIMDNAVKAIRANFGYRNQRVFFDMPDRHRRLVAERKNQIREWVAVVRILRDPLNHSFVLARVTDRGEHSGRNLMSHDLRNRVILGGLDAMTDAQLGDQLERQPQG